MKQFLVNWFNIFEAELHFLCFYFGVNASVFVFTSDGWPRLGHLHTLRNNSKNAVQPSRNLCYGVPLLLKCSRDTWENSLVSWKSINGYIKPLMETTFSCAINFIKLLVFHLSSQHWVGWGFLVCKHQTVARSGVYLRVKRREHSGSQADGYAGGVKQHRLGKVSVHHQNFGLCLTPAGLCWQKGVCGTVPGSWLSALELAAAIDKLPQCSISAVALWRPPEAPAGAGGGCGLGGLWGGGAHAAAPTLPTGSLSNFSGVLKGLGPSCLRDIPSSHPWEER